MVASLIDMPNFAAVGATLLPRNLPTLCVRCHLVRECKTLDALRRATDKAALALASRRPRGRVMARFGSRARRPRGKVDFLEDRNRGGANAPVGQRLNNPSLRYWVKVHLASASLPRFARFDEVFAIGLIDAAEKIVILNVRRIVNGVRAIAPVAAVVGGGEARAVKCQPRK